MTRLPLLPRLSPVVLLIGLACRAADPGAPPTDASYEAAPGRQVVWDALPATIPFPDAPPRPDREPADLPPAEGPVVDAGPDAPGGCSLLKQDCPKGGCYPAPAGGARCVAPGGTIGQYGYCTDHEQCDPGLVCAAPIGFTQACLRICDPREADACGKGSTCSAVTDAAGYCYP